MENIKTTDQGRRHQRELLVNGHSVSRLVVIDTNIRINSARIRMGGIGGVQTDKEHRMKGYCRVLMEDAIRYMKEEGYDVSMLFGIPGFYRRFGYAPWMPEYRTTIATRVAEKAEVSPSVRGYRVRETREEDMAEIVALYNKNNSSRNCPVIRDKKEFKNFPKGLTYGSKAESFLIEDRGKRFTGYAVLDRSEEEVNLIEVESKSAIFFPVILRHLADIAVRRRCGQVSLFLPLGHPFAEFCKGFDSEMNVRYFKDREGMIRIINQFAFLQKMQDELSRRIACYGLKGYSGLLNIKTDMETTSIGIHNGRVGIQPGKKRGDTIVLSHPELAQMVTGYRSAGYILSHYNVNKNRKIWHLLNILFPAKNTYFWLADRF